MSESNRSKELAERFTTYSNEVIACVENCSEEDWSKTCPYEGWTVGVVARHIAVHYGIVGWVKKIAAGEELPDRKWDAVDQWAEGWAQENAECTKDDALSALRDAGASVANCVTGLTDADLDRTAYLSLTGADISIPEMIQNHVMGRAHYDSLMAGLGTQIPSGPDLPAVADAGARALSPAPTVVL